jgi:integrase
MFRDAMNRKLISENPFAHVRHRIGDVSERRAYIPADDALRVIEHCPNTTWKVLVALSRFAGLRTPSESLSLKWADVDWERQRITVPVPKLQHLPGRGYRIIPMFPEVRP